jgi:hypothetical protein
MRTYRPALSYLSGSLARQVVYPLRMPRGPKIEDLVERLEGKIRADKAHETLVGMGYQGSERTTRRAVAEGKRRWRQGHGRRYRPWIPEPGLWMQWD